jgi:hypothetical protein
MSGIDWLAILIIGLVWIEHYMDWKKEASAWRMRN